jgi:Transcription factor WhiB
MSASLTCVRDPGPAPAPTLAAWRSPLPGLAAEAVNQALPLCQSPGADADWWYPEPGDRRTAALAKRLCAACPIRELCLSIALDSNEPHGIWAGLSPDQRRKLPRHHVCRGCGGLCSTRGWYCGDECRSAARAAQDAAHTRRKRLGIAVAS